MLLVPAVVLGLRHSHRLRLGARLQCRKSAKRTNDVLYASSFVHKRPPGSSPMRYRFPPLNSLKIFEAVLRRGSIRQAAEELCLTPQAVSQQLKQLEAFVGQALFVRGVRNITP